MSEQIDVPGPMYRPSRDDQGVDKGTMRLLYIAGFGGVAIMAGLAIYGLIGHGGHDTLPVVQAATGPMRVKPDNPGGMVVQPEDQAQTDPSQSHLAPGTEEPNPRALLAITGPAKGAAAAAASTPPALVAPSHAKPVIVMLSAAKSEAVARADWDRLAKRQPDLFGPHRPLFLKTNEPGPAPWRLRTAGFTNPAQAKTFCEKVKAKGGQCTVVES